MISAVLSFHSFTRPLRSMPKIGAFAVSFNLMGLDCENAYYRVDYDWYKDRSTHHKLSELIGNGGYLAVMFGSFGHILSHTHDTNDMAISISTSCCINQQVSNLI